MWGYSAFKVWNGDSKTDALPPLPSPSRILSLSLDAQAIAVEKLGTHIDKSGLKKRCMFHSHVCACLVDWKEELFDDDRLYSAILRSLEQTHCARMWFYMSDLLFIAHFGMSTEVVYL